jgi:hypothetical protein
LFTELIIPQETFFHYDACIIIVILFEQRKHHNGENARVKIEPNIVLQQIDLKMLPFNWHLGMTTDTSENHVAERVRMMIRASCEKCQGKTRPSSTNGASRRRRHLRGTADIPAELRPSVA